MKYLVYLFLSLLIIASACNDSVIVGSDLLGSESVDIEVKNDLELKTKTVLGDSTLMFRKIDTDEYGGRIYLVGEIEDPTFGSTVTKSYFSPGLEGEMPRFTSDNLDSVVMVLALDSLGRYGDPDAVHDLSLAIIQERMDKDDRETFYSNLEIPAESTPIHTVTTKINYSDSLTINNHFQDSLVQVPPQLRFRLDNQYWINLRESIVDSLDEDLYLDVIPGYELSSSVSNSMLGLNLGFNDDESPSNILFYYTRGDTAKLRYTLPLGKYRHSHVSKDYSSSSLMNDLDSTTTDCLYLESQGGTNLVVDFSSIHEVDDLILNHATLELTVKPFDEDSYPAIQAIGAWYKNENGDFVRADRSDRLALLEETYPMGVQKWSYELDLTAYVSQLRSGAVSNYEIYIFALTKAERANRSLLYSSSNSEHPVKLNLILTKP